MKNYIITTAQSNARPHKTFMSGLHTYADKHDADILEERTELSTIEKDKLKDFFEAAFEQ